jgi:glucose-6-phosphate 1-dehydrogenase
MTDTLSQRRAGVPVLDEQQIQQRFLADGDGATLHANPLRRGLADQRTPQPCIMVIFGVTGDLTARKLMPAMYDLHTEQPLPEGFTIVGVSHRDWTDETMRDELRKGVEEHARQPVTQESWDAFASSLFYVKADFRSTEAFQDLRARLDQLDAERRSGGNRLFYLATPPSYYGPIIQNLGAVHLARRQDIYTRDPGGWHRIVVEKPFGRDVESARELNAEIAAVFSEQQIYRIDHYLGKETVQNVLAFRFANILFEPVWNRHYVDHVQITVAESLGVEGRGAYYEESGALRDMVQSHILQLLCVVAMEPPAHFDGNSLRDEKVKVLRSVAPPVVYRDIAEKTVRGQYTSGYVAGQHVPGYREEDKVNPVSRTETYTALKMEIENWRWAGVPFYLRTGKRMSRRVTEIAIEFKQVPHMLFKEHGAGDLNPNVLTIRIQPDEGITLRFAAKVPGAANHLRPVRMDFQYGTSFGQAGPDAYERLLFDAMIGDPSLFARRDEVETAWGIVQPILDAWASDSNQPAPYEAGTWGPYEAEMLLARDGRTWRRP